MSIERPVKFTVAPLKFVSPISLTPFLLLSTYTFPDITKVAGAGVGVKVGVAVGFGVGVNVGVGAAQLEDV